MRERDEREKEMIRNTVPKNHRCSVSTFHTLFLPNMVLVPDSSNCLSCCRGNQESTVYHSRGLSLAPDGSSHLLANLVLSVSDIINMAFTANSCIQTDLH